MEGLESGADGGGRQPHGPQHKVAAGEAQQGGLWRHRVLREEQGKQIIRI